MTEFPALREALVGAATRRRRRRRVVGAAVPLLAAATAAVAALALSPAPPPDRERVAEPAPTELGQAFAVFRRPQRASDRMPSLRVVPGTVDKTGTRLLGQGGPTRFFAAPTMVRGVPTLCLVSVRGRVGSSAGCAPVSDALKERTPPAITTGDVTGVFLPDSSTDLRFIFPSGVGSVSPANNLSLSMNPVEHAIGTSWTGASGTRYVRYTGSPPTAAPQRFSCPAKLEPLPRDAVTQARRAALIAVDQLYPGAREAKVERRRSRIVSIDSRTGDIIKDAPCGKETLARTVLIQLRLTPSEIGEVLVGRVDGAMRVVYVLR